ncbi:MAG: HEPN domain-containing protein [Campylobacterales bacterium]|nr:HEPN domain-containing protein [Campylobacterales bacterium]
MLKLSKEFDVQIQSCKELYAVYGHLKNNLSYPLDLSDLLRAQVVYAVSALDKLVHELVKKGMVEIFEGKRLKTTTFSNFGISLNTLIKIQEVGSIAVPQSIEETAIYWFEREISLKHKSLSFQAPDKISEALSLIWLEEHKWQKIHFNIIIQPIGSLVTMTERDMKTYLKNIVARRNQIVHEADINIICNSKDTMDEDEANNIVQFIDALGKSIYKCVI